MIRKLWIIQTIFIMIGVLNAYAGEIFPATVQKVIDGDSLLVATAKNTIEVRLYGVDCPEYDQPYSKVAKKFVEKSVLGKKVMIEPAYRDSYGRLVAVVVRDKKVLNNDLIQAGLAWVYPRYCRKTFCNSWKKNERIARREKRGLWHDAQPDSPWQWKKMKRSR